MGSCKEDEVSYYKLGSEFVVSTHGYTTLDNSVVLSVDTAFNVSSLTVTHMGGFQADGKTAFVVPNTALGTLTVTNGVGELVVSDVNMGMNVIGMKSTVRFTAVADDGTDINRSLSVAVTNPFAITKPTVLNQKNADVDFKFKITPATATVTSVGVQTKKFYNGTYADVAGPFTTTGTVKINGSNYSIGDTIYVKVTASTAAPRTAVSVTKLVVGMYSYPTTTTVKLTPSTTTSIYDLAKRRFIKNVDEVAMLDSVDIKYARTDFSGGFTIGFTAPQKAQFVKVTGTPTEIATVYSNANAVTTAATDFSSAVTSVADVAVGDVYIYRTQRGSAAYTYGMLKITAVSKPEGVAANSSFTFELKNI